MSTSWPTYLVTTAAVIMAFRATVWAESQIRIATQDPNTACTMPFEQTVALLTSDRDQTEINLIAYLKCSADDPRAWNTLGSIRLNKKDYGQAEQLFRRALELAPHVSKYKYNLSVSLFRQGHYLESARHMGQLYQKDPDYILSRTDKEKAYEILQQERTRSDSPVLDRAWRTLHKNPEWLPATTTESVDPKKGVPYVTSATTVSAPE